MRYRQMTCKHAKTWLWLPCFVSFLELFRSMPGSSWIFGRMCGYFRALAGQIQWVWCRNTWSTQKDFFLTELFEFLCVLLQTTINDWPQPPRWFAPRLSCSTAGVPSADMANSTEAAPCFSQAALFSTWKGAQSSSQRIYPLLWVMRVMRQFGKHRTLKLGRRGSFCNLSEPWHIAATWRLWLGTCKRPSRTTLKPCYSWVLCSTMVIGNGHVMAF